jgi:hypothetical protein
MVFVHVQRPTRTDNRDYNRPCPACGYGLRGQGSSVCPECGLESDPETRILGFTPARTHLSDALKVIGLLFLLLWSLIRIGTPIEEGDLMLLGLACVYVLVCVIRFTKASSTPTRLIISSQGLLFENLRASRIRWHDVMKAKYSWLTGKMYVISTRREKLAQYHWKTIGSPSKARKCAREINRLRRKYLQAP